MGNLIITSLVAILVIIFSYFAVRFIYAFLFFNILRIIFFVVSLLILIFVDFKIEKAQKLGFFLFLIQFVYVFIKSNKEGIKDFLELFKNTFTGLYNFFAFIFQTIGSIIKFFVQLFNGFHHEKVALKKERENFEEERQWLEEERRKINAEWEKVFWAWEKIKQEREKTEGTHKEHYYEKQQQKQKEEGTKKTAWNRPKSANLEQEKYDLLVKMSIFDFENLDKNDPYKVLDLDRNATKEAIKKRLRELVILIHPDKWRQADEEERYMANKIMTLLNNVKERLIGR